MVFSKAVGVVFTELASRFIDQEAVKEYLFRFARISLNEVIHNDKPSVYSRQND